jgi:hypothetical protein
MSPDPRRSQVGGSGASCVCTFGPLRLVADWKLTFEMSPNLKPFGRPPSVKTTEFLMSSFFPTSPFPVQGMSPAKVIEKSRPSGPTLANQEEIDHDHHNCCPPQLFLRIAIATAEASTPNLVAISAIGTHLSAQTTTNLGPCL